MTTGTRPEGRLTYRRILARTLRTATYMQSHQAGLTDG